MSASSLWQRASIAGVVTTALLVSACGGSSGKAGGNFCKSLSAAVNSNAVTAGGTTPADLKASLQKSQKVGLEALSKAPSAIKPEVKVLIDASAKLYAVLKKDDYDITKLTPADEAAFSTPDVDAASTKVSAYVKANCGIDLTGGATASHS